MPVILSLFIILFTNQVYAQEEKKEKLPLFVTTQLELGKGQALAGKTKDLMGKKMGDNLSIESGVKLSGNVFEIKGLLFFTKNDLIAPGYLAFGPKMTMGSSEQFIKLFKWKANMDWTIIQAQKDDSRKWNFVPGVGMEGLVGLCTSEKKEKDDAKFRLCLEAFNKLIGYLANDYFAVRLDAGVGIKGEIKISEHKINVGARYSVMIASPGIYNDQVTAGEHGSLNLGMDFDVTGRASRAANKK